MENKDEINKEEMDKEYIIPFIDKRAKPKLSNAALETLSINHLEKFKEYILDELGNNDDVINELRAVIN